MVQETKYVRMDKNFIETAEKLVKEGWQYTSRKKDEEGMQVVMYSRTSESKKMYSIYEEDLLKLISFAKETFSLAKKTEKYRTLEEERDYTGHKVYTSIDEVIHNLRKTSALLQKIKKKGFDNPKMV